MTDLNWLRKVKSALYKQLIPDNVLAKVYEENYLTFVSGTSNKFHLFSLYGYQDRNGRECFIAGNAYGRIGVTNPQGCIIEESCNRGLVEREMQKKILAKINKGYKTDTTRKSLVIEDYPQRNTMKSYPAVITPPAITTVMPPLIPEFGQKVARRKFDLSI